MCFEHGCANGARVSEVLFRIACVLQVKTKLPLGNDHDNDDELIAVEIRLSSSYDNIIYEGGWLADSPEGEGGRREGGGRDDEIPMILAGRG